MIGDTVDFRPKFWLAFTCRKKQRSGVGVGGALMGNEILPENLRRGRSQFENIAGQSYGSMQCLSPT